MAVDETVIRLRNVEAAMNRLAETEAKILAVLDSGVMPVEYYRADGWRVAKKGNMFEYQREVTMTGAAQNIDLAVPFACVLRRWDTWADDATAKSYTLDVYSGAVTPTSYTRVDNVAADTNQSRSFTSDKADSYLQSPVVLRTAITASTNGKKITIKILLER